MTGPSRRDRPIPVLLRAARGAYGRAIRARMERAGLPSLPPEGAAMLTRVVIGRSGDDPGLEELMARGFARRGPEGVPSLTDQGRAAFDEVVEGSAEVDAALYDRLGEDGVVALRTGLLALADLAAEARQGDAPVGERPGRLRRWSPILPVRDLDAALSHYASLGFRTEAYDGGYAFADRDRTGLHLSTDHNLDPATNTTSAYLYVDDAAALHEEWTRPGIAGTTTAPEPMPWKLLEGSHVDPDGNRIRFGSRLRP